MKYRCKECQDEFAEEGEADFHAYDAHDMDFEECIMEIEEENLVEDSPEDEESLDESSSKTEREVATEVFLENFDKIKDKTLEGQVLSVALGQSVGSNKKFPRKVSTKEAFKAFYEKAVEKLLDEKTIACPMCGKQWKTIFEDMKENLTQHEKLEVKVPLMRMTHVKAEHKALWRVVQHLFGKSAEDMPDTRPSTVPNPESCSELSREELAETIGKSPELRRQFFRKWLESLKERD